MKKNKLPRTIRRLICLIRKHDWVHCYGGWGCSRCGAYFQNEGNPNKIIWKNREDFVEWWNKNNLN